MEDIIKRYLIKSPSFALMIDGKWGTGKTYYVEHSLKKIIEEIKIKNPSRENEEINLKMLYTSANGIRSFADISNQLFIANYNLDQPKKKLLRLTYEITKASIGTIAKLKGLEKALELWNKIIPQKSDLINFYDKVIIIDDIERINLDSLPIDEFIGKINSLITEHEKIRVILIGDEYELKKKMKKYASNFYGIIKEKTIYRTIKFENNIKNILTHLFSNILNNNPHLDKFQNNSDFILELINNSKEDNLRNINFFIEIVADIIAACPKNLPNSLTKRIMYSTYILCKEYKDNQFTNDEHNKAPYYIQYFGFNEGIKVNLTTGDPFNNSDPRTKRYEQFKFKLPDLYNYFQSIYNFVCTGSLCETLFIKEYETLESKLVLEKDSTTQINNLVDFRSLSDEEFKSAFYHVLAYITEGEYNLYYFLLFIRYSIFFIEKNINPEFKDVDSLIEFLLDHIDKVRKYPAQISSVEINVFNESLKKYPKLETIEAKYKEIINIQISNNIKERGKKLLSELLDDVIKFNSSKFNELFTSVEANEMGELISKYLSDNVFASNFNSNLRHGWHIYHSEHNKINLKSNLLELVQRIKKEISPTSILIKLYVSELEERATSLNDE
jgi:hypothetical protein